jgi:predicted anti-sigma-YlaC factor YlaD
MTTLTCAQLCEAAPELALGTLPGRQRAAALAHLDRCVECRLTVEELSDAADALLLLAPDVAPPAGFARRVANGFVAPRQPRWRAIARVAAVAAAVLALAMAGVAVVSGRPGPAPHPSFALGDPGVRLAQFVPANGERVHGLVFASADSPSWVFMTVQDEGSSDKYRCQIAVGNDQWIDVGSFQLHDGSGSWGKAVTADLHQPTAVRLLDEHGAVAATASLS